MSFNEIFKDAIKEQYGASIKMLENLITNCPDELWEDNNRETIISQVVYHTLFFIDFYLSKTNEEKGQFKGKLGDDFMGERTDGMEWNKIYSKEELLSYAKDTRIKANKRFSNLTIEELASESLFEWHGNSVLSSLMYNLRHIMLHVGALHVRINAVNEEPMKWVSKFSIGET